MPELTNPNIQRHTDENPVVRFVMKRFTKTVGELAVSTNPKTILDIGCGEGFATAEIADRLPDVPIRALDLDPPRIAYARAHHARKNVSFDVGDVFQLQGKYDLVVSNELLEHLTDYETALQSILSASNRYVLLSVPNEPLFRIGNMLRGKYVGAWGNFPEHVNHWRPGKFRKLCEKYGTVLAAKKSSFWTIVLLEKRQV